MRNYDIRRDLLSIRNVQAMLRIFDALLRNRFQLFLIFIEQYTVQVSIVEVALNFIPFLLQNMMVLCLDHRS